MTLCKLHQTNKKGRMMDVNATFEGDKENLEKTLEDLQKEAKKIAEANDVIMKKITGQIYKIDGTPKKR